jgi:hypothetical protein
LFVFLEWNTPLLCTLHTRSPSAPKLRKQSRRLQPQGTS